MLEPLKTPAGLVVTPSPLHRHAPHTTRRPLRQTQPFRPPDFYHVFKAPPFAEHHVLNQKENLHDDAHFPHVWGPNGGFLYLQNARPDGPSTWLVAEAIGRHLRWRGNRGWWTDGWGGPPNCLMMDQDGLGAVLRSSMLGRPIFQAGVDCLFHGLPDREELRERYKDVSRNVDGLARLFYAKHPLKSVTTSAEWRPYVGADSWHLHGFPIVVPNSGGEVRRLRRARLLAALIQLNTVCTVLSKGPLARERCGLAVGRLMLSPGCSECAIHQRLLQSARACR